MATCITTPDGTTIIHDADVGVISAPSRDLAEAEIRRRKANDNRKPLPVGQKWEPWTVHAGRAG